MTKEQRNCPDARSLSRFLLEEVDDPTTETHLSECGDCQRQLEEIAAAPTVWCSAQEYLRDLFDGEHDGDGAFAASTAALDSQFLQNILGPTDDPAMLGRIGTYEVSGVVGYGGTAIVLKAYDARLNRFVAIKVLAPLFARNGSARARFEREGKAIASVVDDHVIAVHAVDEHMGLPYIVMQYVAGNSLQHRIDNKRTLETREIVRIGLQVSRALSATHQHGIIHRDIKPANILLEDGVERARVGDFGLVQVADDAGMTQSGVIAGTPQFMSPEQARGEAIDGRSDLFSLGVVMYAMCTGRSPFRASTALGAIRSVTQRQPKPVREINPDIPAWLDSFVLKLLEKNPGDRFASAEDVTSCLAAELSYLNQFSATPPARQWQHVPEQDRTRQGWVRTGVIQLGLIAVAVVGCLIATTYWPGQPEAETPTSTPDFKAMLDVWAANPELVPGKSSVGTIFIETRARIDESDTLVAAEIRLDPGTGEWRPKTSWAASFLRLKDDDAKSRQNLNVAVNAMQRDIVVSTKKLAVDEQLEVDERLGVVCDSSANEHWVLWVRNNGVSDSNHRVCVVHRPTGETHSISSGPGQISHARLSPDAKQVAFVRIDAGLASLHLGNVRTHDSKPIPAWKSIRGFPVALCWSPNGKELAVAVASAEGQLQPSPIRMVVCDLTYGYLRRLPMKNLQLRELKSMNWSSEEWSPVPLSEIGDFPGN